MAVQRGDKEPLLITAWPAPRRVRWPKRSQRSSAGR